MPNPTSLSMQLFHYTYLLFALTVADVPLKKRITYFYLWPINIRLLCVLFSGEPEAPQELKESKSPEESIIIFDSLTTYRLTYYSVFVIHLIISLALLNMFSLIHLTDSPLTEVAIYHIPIMVPLLLGLPFVYITKLIRGVPCSQGSIRGGIAFMIVASTIMVACFTTWFPATIKDNFMSVIIIFLLILPPSLILWYILNIT